MHELLRKSAIHISSAIKKGEVSSEEVANFFLERISSLDGKLKSFITVCENPQHDSSSNTNSPLFGVPIAIKDNMVTRGVRTTCASRILENYIPPYDATCIERLKKSGLIIIGKTNMDEFAMGSSTENSAFFPTRNPWDLERVPGGSSGGSAASVGAFEVPVALGSDTGGSIRQPASFCSVVGLKPTYGRVSRFGLVAFASSLDQIGPITRTVEDCAALLGIIAGYDRRDSTCPDAPVPNYLEEIKKDVKGFKFGIPQEYFEEGIDSCVKDVCLSTIGIMERELGMIPVEISLPHTRYALAVYYIIAPAEASSNLARYDGVRYGLRIRSPELAGMYVKTRMAGFGQEVKRRILTGTYVLSSGYYEAYYGRAQRVRTLVKRDFDEAFSKVDVIVTPVSPTPPFKLGEKTDDPIKMYLSDIFTIPVNLAGIPAVSIPCGFVNGKLPVGIQLIGKHFDEVSILAVGRALEEVLDVKHHIPKL